MSKNIFTICLSFFAAGFCSQGVLFNDSAGLRIMLLSFVLLNLYFGMSNAMNLCNAFTDKDEDEDE